MISRFLLNCLYITSFSQTEKKPNKISKDSVQLYDRRWHVKKDILELPVLWILGEDAEVGK